MAEGKNTFMLYADMIGVFEKLPDEKAGQLIKHVFRYVNDQNPETDDLILNIAFEPIKAKLKRDLKKWEDICEKNRENVNIRWNKRNTTVTSRIRSDTKNTDKDKDKDKEKDKDKRKADPAHFSLAIYLKEKILKVKQQRITDRTLDNWAEVVRLMEERDSRSIKEVRAMIDECHDMPLTKTGFTWRNNILSMQTLRDRWNEGKIWLGMTEKPPSTEDRGFIPPYEKPDMTGVPSQKERDKLLEEARIAAQGDSQ
jgi:hypothetical protein